MLCKTAHPGSTYNDLRLQDKCNVIVIMRGDYAGDYKPNYVLDGTSIAVPGAYQNGSSPLIEITEFCGGGPKSFSQRPRVTKSLSC